MVSFSLLTLLQLGPLPPPRDVDSEEAFAESPSDIVITEDARAGGPSQRRLTVEELARLPMASTDDALRAMPGLHVSVHGGRGKAYQFFLRGFDAVHGADIAVTLEGVPLNEPSNVHGNGYLDLQFIPQDLLQSIRLSPGVWRVQDGNFAVAGAAELSLGLSAKGSMARVGVGTDMSLRGSAAWSPKDGEAGDFAIAEFEGGEGIGAARAYRQIRGGLGGEWEAFGGKAKGFVLAYDGVFESPGVLREDDVDSGEVAFLGAYPVTQGGHSSRVLGGLGWHLDQGQRHTDIQAWLGWRDLSLLQNYTGFQRDLTFGDGTLQAHQSIQAGVKGSRVQALSPTFGYRLGGGADIDGFEQGESTMDTLGGARDTLFDARGITAHIGGWGGLYWAPTPALTLEPGLRVDGFAIGVQSGGETGGEERLWAWAPVIAPRISANVTPGDRARLSGSYGRGLRTPEARGIDVSGRAPMTLTDSFELGGLVSLVSNLNIGLSTFATFVSDELIFDHIEARFLTSGRTRRLGVDGHVEWSGKGGLHVDANLSLTDGRYGATGEPIPYAPRVLALGTVGYGGLAPGGLFIDGGIRGWALGARPLPGGFESTPAAVFDLTAKVSRGPWRGAIDVVNVLNRAYRDGEFFYASHWDPEAPVSERPVRHFSAGVPRTLRFSLERSFK